MISLFDNVCELFLQHLVLELELAVRRIFNRLILRLILLPSNDALDRFELVAEPLIVLLESDFVFECT